MNPPSHPQEAQRLALLRELDLFDRDEPQPGLDAIVACAARLTGIPIALITLIGADEQHLLARRGLDLTRAPRAHAFCAHTILGNTLLEVPDLQQDPRFHDNPFVADAPHIRFYAGQPLIVDGLALGTLCLLDVEPRRLSAADRETLAQLGVAAVELLQSGRHLQQAARQRERLLDFARAGGDWMWESDAQHRYRWLSDAVEAITGLSAASQIGRPISDAALLDDQGAPRAEGLRYHALLARHQAFARVLTEKQTPRGRLFLSRSAVPVFDADGRFAGYRGTVRDVTAAMDSAAAARRSEARLRQLAGQVPGVLFTFHQQPDGSAEYPFVSEGAERCFGLSAATLQADAGAFARQVHPHDLQTVRDELARGSRELRPIVQSYRLQLPDGSWRWIETRSAPSRLADGSTLWHGFSGDVTERRATEEALREHEERWQLAAAAAGIGIAQLTLADGQWQLDERACRNHGLPQPQPRFTLADWLAQIDPADRDAAAGGVQRTLADGRPVEGRYRIHRPDGSVRWLEFVVRATHDAQGVATGVIGTCRDVDEQHRAAELSRGKLEAERASRAKSEFLSRVSHELRTPLNGILGFAQLMSLDHEHPLAPVQAQRLSSVQRAGRHLLELINDVLELSRIESADRTVHTDSVELDAALHGSLALVQPVAEHRGIGLRPPAASGLWVRGDARAIEQVLMNLLSNAIKYSPEGSAPVDVTIAADPETVRMAVRDHGIGLDTEQRSRLFQPFDRLGAERQRIEGSGLGLVIARELAEAMGGAIEVDSAAGQGSTFTLRLQRSTAPPPADGATEPAAPQRPAAAPADARPLRQVVYVEDELLNQILLQEVFRARPSWQLHVADDAVGGQRLARELRPDLMLIDMNLPDASGIELIGRLRADPATQGLRCIALSADAMREQIDAARSAGFDDYWTKPIDVARVLGALDALLGPPG